MYKPKTESLPPLPYHVYGKTPGAKRFSRIEKDAYRSPSEAHDALKDHVLITYPPIGTRYQIRQGRRVIYSCTVWREDNDLY